MARHVPQGELSGRRAPGREHRRDPGIFRGEQSSGPEMTPEEIVQLIVQKVEEGDPEVLSRISLVMKNRLLQKKEDLKEIETILLAGVKK
jgi:hypothetical protein